MTAELVKICGSKNDINHRRAWFVKKMPREISHANGVEDIVVQERRGASNIAAVRSFIRSHEVLTFFLLAYAIAWGALALIMSFISGSRIEVVAIPLRCQPPSPPPYPES